MDHIKEIDRAGIKKKEKFWRIKQIIPSCGDDKKDVNAQKAKDDDAEDDGAVKSIPVEHFLINLNFLAASKLIKQFFREEIEINNEGESKEVVKGD